MQPTGTSLGPTYNMQKRYGWQRGRVGRGREGERLKVTHRARRGAVTRSTALSDVECRYRQALMSSAKSRSLRDKTPFLSRRPSPPPSIAREMGRRSGEMSIGVCNTQGFRKRANSTSGTQYYKIIDCQSFCSVPLRVDVQIAPANLREYRNRRDSNIGRE